MAMIIGLVVAAIVLVGQATVLRHRADSAADLGALAAARTAQIGGDGCSAAARVVAADNGFLAGCTGPSATGTVEVRVRVVGTLFGGLNLTAGGTALAGPAPGS